jgi:hypothetical protein
MAMQRFSTILTSEQAAILYDLVKANKEVLVSKWADGVFYGLLQALTNIDRSGGAYIHDRALSYGSGLVEAAIIPASTYIAWPGAKAPIPTSYWDVAALAPRLDCEYRGQKLIWEPVSVYRVMVPLVIAPLPTVILPLLPPE